MADRHAVASGEDENEHEENIIRDIHIGKRGSATAKEEQPDKLRRTVRFEQEAPNTSTSSSSTTPCVRWVDERVVTSKKCWIGIERKIPEISISELNDVVESMTCLNAHTRKFWEIN